MTKKILITFITTVALILTFMGCSEYSEEDDEKILADETVQIPALSYQSWDINLSASATIFVDLEVKNGNGIRFYTVDQEGFEAIKAGKNTFTYFPSLSSNAATKKLSLSATVNTGHTYFVTINDNFLSAQEVYTKIVVKR